MEYRYRRGNPSRAQLPVEAASARSETGTVVIHDVAIDSVEQAVVIVNVAPQEGCPRDVAILKLFEQVAANIGDLVAEAIDPLMALPPVAVDLFP